MKVGESYDVRFSPDGMRLAVVSKNVSVWDLRSQDRLLQTTPLSDPSHVAFSPDGRTLVVKNTSGRMVVVDGQDAHTVRTLDEGGREGCPPRVSACGRLVVDGSWSGDLVVRDLASGATVSSREFPGEGIVAIHYLPGPSRWVVVHAPKATTDDRPPAPAFFSIWDSLLAPARPLQVSPPLLSFHAASAASPDGTQLAIVHGAPPNTLSIVDLVSGATTREVSVASGGYGKAVAWSSRGVLAVALKRRCEFYDAESLTLRGAVDLQYPCAVDFSFDGHLVAVGSWSEGVVRHVGEILEDEDEAD